ncbi:MAG: hypothetical protein R2722_15380 [Tessaracoccus sp.]
MTADPRDPVRIRWYALVLFLAHIGVLIVGCSSLWRITNGGWSGTFAAVCFTAAYAALWAVWLVPGSGRRLAYRERLIANLVAGTVVVILAGFAGAWMTALVAASIVILCDALNERSIVGLPMAPPEIEEDDGGSEGHRA